MVMRRGQSVLCGALGLLGLVPGLARAAAILIPNGSFESTPEGDVIAAGSPRTLNAPESTSISGWSVALDTTINPMNSSTYVTYASGGYAPAIQNAWGAWDGTR